MIFDIDLFSKVIEWAMLDQLWEVLEENKIIPLHQSAYGKLHSTETPLCKIYNDHVIRTSQDQTSRLIPRDLFAAFDTVDHRILIAELFQCGIRDSALALLKSNLVDPYQQVLIGSAVSESSFLQCGVPLDSI